MRRLIQRLATLPELARVLVTVPEIELKRRSMGPKPLLEIVRERGSRSRGRAPVARARLRNAIRWVDARFPDGGNCYRRALLEIALDRDAAAEPFRMGLSIGGGPRSGHAWLADRIGRDESYDAEVTL
jgi:hypothetical protein